MFQKLAPLLILALFAVGVYFMIEGMNNAVQMGKPKKGVEAATKP